MSFGTFSLADIAQQVQTSQLREEQINALRDNRAQSQAEAERAAQREQAAMIARLTEGVQDDATYQQRRQAALAYGMDAGAIPEQYDPEFVQTYNVLATTLLRPDGERKLTTTAEELVDAGYQPGTPEFIAMMRRRLESKDSRVVSTTAGGMAGVLGSDGGYKPLILPNDGSGAAGAPVGSAGGPREGATATNPTTGEKLQYRGGRWVPMGGAGGNVSGNFPGY